MGFIHCEGVQSGTQLKRVDETHLPVYNGNYVYCSLTLLGILNHCSNAVKFTHEGKVGINLQVVHDKQPGCKIEGGKIHKRAYSGTAITAAETAVVSPRNCDNDNLHCSKHEDAFQNGVPTCENFKEDIEGEEVVWLRCDVYDTGIGIPGFP
jgi:signal transduction histidine kinase